MKKSLLLTKRWLLLGVLLLITTTAYSGVPHNHRTVADNDTLQFRAGRVGGGRVPGHIFNAVDPRYIINRNGFSTRVSNGESTKEFGLHTFNDFNAECFNGIDNFFDIEHTSIIHLGVVWRWNYFINDHQLQFNTRALVKTLMPQALERVSFTSVLTDSANVVPNHISRNPWDRETGRVRIYTRPIPYTNTDANILYLLDGVPITPRIFEAIKPIYIRSLERITDSDVLSSFNQVGLQEVVKIETFSHRELGKTIHYNPATSLLLVDGIVLYPTTDLKFKSDFFKESRQIFSDNDEDFETLQQQFPGKRHFRIITICSEFSEL